MGHSKEVDCNWWHVVEYSPDGASQGTGMIEGQTRVFLSALEEKWGRCVPYVHSLICFNVEWAGVLLRNRLEFGWTEGLGTSGTKEKATRFGIGKVTLLVDL